MFKVLVPFTFFLLTFGKPFAPFPHGLVPILDGKIVGGVNTTIDQYPHQISLKYFDSHRCGGSVIQTRIVITAAHCVSGIGTTYLSVTAGTMYREAGGVNDNVKSIVIHENFDPFVYYSDVAILLMNKGFDYTRIVQPIALASAGEVLRAGTRAYVTGWGTMWAGGSLPDLLQMVAISIVSNADCQVAYEGKYNITGEMLCAGEPFGGRDACQGDSGGPLIVGSKLYGLVSWGIGCAQAEHPGVYASVGMLRKWIDARISEYIG